jgi:hypothetical protein
MPDITLIEFNAVLAQQLAIFFLECASAMVPRLPLNISEQQHRTDSGSPKMRRNHAAKKSPDTVHPTVLIHFEEVFFICSMNSACERVRGRLVTM